MEQISRGFVGRTLRAVLFIFLIIIFCTAISSAGIYLASRFGLTQSREQVPLTALSLGKEGEVELPGRGKMVDGDGWKLRNSRDIYTLTLDNAVIEGTQGSSEDSGPAVDVKGDLIIELKDGSGSWIRSGGAGIRIQSGTLVIKGKGSLDIEAGDVGILGLGWDQGQNLRDQNQNGEPDGSKNGSQYESQYERQNKGQAALRLEGGQLHVKGRNAGIGCPYVELAGGSGQVSAEALWGIGISSCNIKVEESEGRLTVMGDGAAMAASGTEENRPFVKVDGKMAVEPEDARVIQLSVSGFIRPSGEKDTEGSLNILTYSSGDAVNYNEETSCFDGAVKEISFTGQ